MFNLKDKDILKIKEYPDPSNLLVSPKERKLYCPFCGESFDRIRSGGWASHFKKCCKEHDIDEDKEFPKEFRRFIFIIYNLPEINTRDKFIEEYKELSYPDAFKKYGSFFDIETLCLGYDVEKRSYKESSYITQRKIKDYYQTHYGPGITNALSKGTPGYEKRNNTVKSRYGVDNVFQIPEVIEKIWDDERNIQRYGCTLAEMHSKWSKAWYDSLSDDELEDFLNRSLWKNGKPSGLNFKKEKGVNVSSLERKAASFLSILNIDFETQFRIKFNIKDYLQFKCIQQINRKTKMYFYDFYIKGIPGNYLLEINGDLWHANPEKYKESDELVLPNGNTVLAKDIWEQDLCRKQVAEDRGYKILYVWEKEINKIKTADAFFNLLKIKAMEEGNKL